VNLETDTEYAVPRFTPFPHDDDIYEGPTKDLEPTAYTADDYMRRIREAAARNAAPPTYWQPWQRPALGSESSWLGKLLGWVASGLAILAIRLVFGAYHGVRLTVWAVFVHGTAWWLRGPIRCAVGLVVVVVAGAYLYLHLAIRH
jgi:hypothetical protein